MLRVIGLFTGLVYFISHYSNTILKITDFICGKSVILALPEVSCKPNSQKPDLKCIFWPSAQQKAFNLSLKLSLQAKIGGSYAPWK